MGSILKLSFESFLQNLEKKKYIIHLEIGKYQLKIGLN